MAAAPEAAAFLLRGHLARSRLSRLVLLGLFHVRVVFGVVVFDLVAVLVEQHESDFVVVLVDEVALDVVLVEFDFEHLFFSLDRLVGIGSLVRISGFGRFRGVDRLLDLGGGLHRLVLEDDGLFLLDRLFGVLLLAALEKHRQPRLSIASAA